MRLPIALTLLLVIAGCGGDDDTTSTATPTAAHPQATASPTAAPTPTATVPPAVTWYRDVEPLVNQVCTRCHNGAGIGPGDFSTYEGAAPLAGVMAAFTGAGLMPPPAADPACRDYEGSERMSLTEEQKAVFQAWAKAGAPKGDPATSPGLPTYEDQLSDPDMILTPPAAHKPAFDATGNEYWCVILDPHHTETFYINAMDVLVDRSDIVHHLVLYLDLDGTSGPEGLGDGDGFECLHTDGNVQMLHAWAPGGGPLTFPEGIGMKVQPGQRFILQMHYYKSSEGAELQTDASGYALRTQPTVDKEMYMVAFGPDDFTIPAGEAAHVETEAYTMNGELPNLTVWGSFPHMHLLGSSYRYWIDRRNGTQECVLDGPRWDFHNQATYTFQEPVAFRQGDTVTFECQWDNSDANPNQPSHPPKDVYFGSGTQDEMCYVFSYVTIGG